MSKYTKLRREIAEALRRCDINHDEGRYDIGITTLIKHTAQGEKIERIINITVVEVCPLADFEKKNY